MKSPFFRYQLRLTVAGIFLFSVFLGPSWAQEAATGWSHESELGVILVGGNSSILSVNANQNTKRSFGLNSLSFQTSYQVASAESTLTTRVWRAGLRYDRQIFKDFNLFLSNDWRGNTFAGFIYQTNVDAGGKYFWVRAKKQGEFEFFTELGYRTQVIRAIDLSQIVNHSLRTFFQVEKGIGPNATARFWVEVVPEFSDIEDLQVNLEPSVRVSLSSVISMKVAYLVNFDNVPPSEGLERIDSTFTTSLVARY